MLLVLLLFFFPPPFFPGFYSFLFTVLYGGLQRALWLIKALSLLLCFCLLRCNLPRKACDWCSNAAPPFFFLISTSGFFFFSCIDQTEPRVAHRSVGPVLYGLSLYVCYLVLHVFHSREENVKYKTPQAENGKCNYNIYIFFFFCFFMQCEEVFFFFLRLHR